MSDDLFAGTSGPKDAKVLLVGEAWGEEEARQRRPFVGPSGWILDKMLAEAGLPRSGVLCTNVISDRPPNNEMNHFLIRKDDKTNDAIDLLGIRMRPSLAQGVERLKRLVQTVRPSVVVAAGNWPLWALSPHAVVKTVKGYKHPTGIANWRGSQTFTRSDVGTFPLLPIYHPAAVMRDWTLRPITVHDLRARAGRFLNGKAGWSPAPSTILSEPTFAQALTWLTADRGWLSVDIETWRRRYISCIGLASSKSDAICLPLFYFDKNGKMAHYWTAQQEVAIWTLLKERLESSGTKIIGQNFAYDTQFFKRWYDINALVSFDTMVAHHLLFPGTPKGLDDLASLYCDHYLFWKKESQDWDTKEFGASAHWLYNAKDTMFTYEVAMALHAVLQQAKMQELYDFQMEQWRLARAMTLRGIRCDLVHKRSIRDQLERERSSIEDWLEQAGPADMTRETRPTPWYNSPTAMMDLFYNQLGFPSKKHKKTERPTMDDSALTLLEERQPWLAPLFQRVRHLRSINVFMSHFIDARISADDRWHCQFNITGTETFRWSSSAIGFSEGTNLQNVPKPVED